MCIAAIAQIAGAVGSVYTATQAGKGPDPAAAQAAADAKAAQSANSLLARRRKALQGQSLLTGGGMLGREDAGASGVLGGAGKSTLGG